LKKIRILIADDHGIVRKGLRLQLEQSAEFEVVGEATEGREALRMAEELLPDVVIMDIAMPSLSGIEATRRILGKSPATKVLVLTSYSNDEYVKQMIEAGVSGYLSKQTASQDLVKAIRETQRGNAFFSPSIARRLRDQSRSPGGPRRLGARSNELTARETQVLRLIAEGYANKQMAAALAISVKTIEKHRQHVMRKLGIHDVAGLTRFAAEQRLIEIAEGPRSSNPSSSGNVPSQEQAESSAAA